MISAGLLEQVGTLPILGICGFSGSGKTTLIEAILPDLLERKLKVAVVKHDMHGIDVDRPGKDSDRLFRAGADVFLQGDDMLIRLHSDTLHEVISWLRILGKRYDLVLVEGFKQSPLPKVWLLGEGEQQPPAGVAGIQTVLSRDDDRVKKIRAILAELFPELFT
jgi:molybdopterin-guanine dinucleotide biosynthesis protein MobB